MLSLNIYILIQVVIAWTTGGILSKATRGYIFHDSP